MRRWATQRRSRLTVSVPLRGYFFEITPNGYGRIWICSSFRPLTGIFFEMNDLQASNHHNTHVSVPLRGYFFEIEGRFRQTERPMAVSVPLRGYFFEIAEQRIYYQRDHQ